jgi:hypothetical protein
VHFLHLNDAEFLSVAFTLGTGHYLWGWGWRQRKEMFLLAKNAFMFLKKIVFKAKIVRFKEF